MIRRLLARLFRRRRSAARTLDAVKQHGVDLTYRSGDSHHVH
jgi:hypothetical protein